MIYAHTPCGIPTLQNSLNEALLYTPWSIFKPQKLLTLRILNAKGLRLYKFWVAQVLGLANSTACTVPMYSRVPASKYIKMGIPVIGYGVGGIILDIFYV